VGAGADVRIHRIDTRGSNLDQNLSSARPRIRNVLELHHPRFADFMYTYRLHRVLDAGCYHGSFMSLLRLHKTVGVMVGQVQVGGGAPIVVQSMTMTDTADARATAEQCVELAHAGAELVRVTVNVPEAARAVPEIKQRMADLGCRAPL